MSMCRVVEVDDVLGPIQPLDDQEMVELPEHNERAG